MLKIYDFWESFAKSRRPKCKSYTNLIIAKLHFFVYVAGFLEPYLTCYQGEGPMIPFMNDDIEKFYRGLLAIVVQPKVLSKCKNGLDLMKLELDENLLLQM